jgi:hypothetical protein
MRLDNRSPRNMRERYVGKALEVRSGFGKRNGTSFSVIVVRHPHSYSSRLPSGLRYPCLIPKGKLRFPCLQNEVHDHGFSPPVGEVPVSGLALRKLNGCYGAQNVKSASDVIMMGIFVRSVIFIGHVTCFLSTDHICRLMPGAREAPVFRLSAWNAESKIHNKGLGFRVQSRHRGSAPRA